MSSSLTSTSSSCKWLVKSEIMGSNPTEMSKVQISPPLNIKLSKNCIQLTLEALYHSTSNKRLGHTTGLVKA